MLMSVFEVAVPGYGAVWSVCCSAAHSTPHCVSGLWAWHNVVSTAST